MSEVRLDQIPPGMVDDLWWWVEDLVERACDSSQGELSPARLRQEARDGLLGLWAASDPADKARPLAVALTRLEDWSGELVLRFLAVAGTDRRRWTHLMERIADLAKQHGVSRIIWEGRLGWQRLMRDFEVTRVVMERRL